MTLEEIVVYVLTDAGIKYEREYKAIKDRRFRYDFYLPDYNILIEVQGGQYMAKSGHNSIKGLDRDYEKCNLAQINGYTILQYGSNYIRTQPFEILEDIKAVKKNKTWRV
jgi:very-short-patch-repair endonuclease